MSIKATIDGKEVELGPKGKRFFGLNIPSEEEKREYRRSTLWRRFNFMDWELDDDPEDVLSDDFLGHYYQQMLNNDVCVYCHSDRRMTRDHIRPKMEGFTLDWSNKAPACERCNSRKGHTSVLEFLLNPDRPATMSP